MVIREKKEMARPKGTKPASERWVLDAIDRNIIALLQANARIQISNLAREIGLSRTATQARLNRLEIENIIRGYTIRLDDDSSWPKAQAFVMLYLGGGFCDRVLPYLEKIPEVKASYSVAGEVDMILIVEGWDMEDIERIRVEIAKIPGIHDFDIRVVIKERFDRRGVALTEFASKTSA